MPASQKYGGSIVLDGATLIFNSTIADATYGITPLIGVRVHNASTAEDIWVFVDAIHGIRSSSGYSMNDFITDPISWGERVGPGLTVEYWCSGGGSKPGSGMIQRVYVQGTDDEYITWSAIAR